MPQTETMTVDAMDAKVEDLLDAVESPELMLLSGSRVVAVHPMITEKKVGRERITFETTQGRVIVYRGAKLDIRRQVPTAEETAEKDRERAAQAVADFESEMRKLAESDATADFIAKVQTNGLEHAIRWDGYDALVTAAKQNIAAGCVKVIEEQGAVAAVRYLQESCTETALREARHPSRSTSPMTNLAAQAAAEAAASFLDGFSFGLSGVRYYMEKGIL